MVVRLLIDNGADVNAPRCVALLSVFLDPFFPKLDCLHLGQPGASTPHQRLFAFLSATPPFLLPSRIKSTRL